MAGDEGRALELLVTFFLSTRRRGFLYSWIVDCLHLELGFLRRGICLENAVCLSGCAVELGGEFSDLLHRSWVCSCNSLTGLGFVMVPGFLGKWR